MMEYRVAFLFLLLTSPELHSADMPSPLSLDIRGTSLTELMNLKVTSLSKKAQPVDEAAAAVYVLTRDEIVRTGATRIPEVLRYVPGVEVARRSAGQWAISIRGFNGNLSNKLLVMIDGRSLYSTLYSGVIWEEKEVVLADVERIEVIRGPGGAIWGGNAVNGVINIITRNATDTQGALVEAGGMVDSSGYPGRLKQEEIPLVARVVVVADVFDALTTKRPYKEAWPIERAVDHMHENKGSHFDPDLIPLFDKLLPEFLEIRKQWDE